MRDVSVKGKKTFLFKECKCVSDKNRAPQRNSLDAYLYTCLTQRRSRCQAFTRTHTWIVRFIEFFFQFLQLFWTKCSSIATKFRLFTIQAARIFTFNICNSQSGEKLSQQCSMDGSNCMRLPIKRFPSGDPRVS